MEINIPPSPSFNDNDMVSIDLNEPPRLSRKDKLTFLIEKYKINEIFSEKLDYLTEYETVILCDDSGSMNTKIKNKNKNKDKNFETRWDELKYIINLLISLLTLYNNNGINIHFLNRGIIENVRYEEEAKYFFFDLPFGETPLTSKLSEIFYNYKDSNKKILIIITTDGAPTYKNKLDLANFKKILQNMDYNKFIVTFLACSDNSQDILYLKDLNNIRGINVLNNYKLEKKEIKKIQGNSFDYSLEDHITRLILQPICEDLNDLNSKRIKDKNNCFIS